MEPDGEVLAALAAGPRVPVEIVDDVEAASGFPLAPGTLFGAIARLEAAGLVELVVRGRGGAQYRLTHAGRERLRERGVRD
ncbi:MAG: helix-turn-helix transcriptional regulator [Candidatus Limnocylindrales bacterium]